MSRGWQRQECEANERVAPVRRLKNPSGHAAPCGHAIMPVHDSKGSLAGEFFFLKWAFEAFAFVSFCHLYQAGGTVGSVSLTVNNIKQLASQRKDQT